MKESIRASDSPKKIKAIHFGVLSPQEVASISEFEVVNRELYSVADRTPTPNGCLDRRLGTSDKSVSCETCGCKLADCAGHFGHIKLELPVFHIGYYKSILNVLQNICKTCSRVLLPVDEYRSFLSKMRNPNLDGLQKKGLVKRIHERCRKTVNCPYCGAFNGSVKKVGALKIIHECNKGKSGVDVGLTHRDAVESNPELKQHLHKAQEDLHPLRVLRLFEAMSSEDVELLGMDPVRGRPELFVWTHLPVPPVCIRPSVAMDASAGSNEDDLTIKLMEIVHINNIIRQAIEKGALISVLMEDWDFLQLQCAMYINSELPGVQLAAPMQGKPTRGFCQRLKGKTGRFRGNLSGKRVDFSSRTVISPDPNLRIDEVGIPELVAKVLTYPERVSEHNIERMRQLIINGPDVHPGANYLQTPDGRKLFLKYVRDRHKTAQQLRVGDIVERHLADGDVVLFNRQPSLHKLSIMAHHVKVRPWRTFRLNECVCGPYNADFDGDEMNVHVPQTEEARAEALVLMGVKDNLVTPRNGEPVIAATQDFLSACYLLSRKDMFYTRAQIAQLCSFMDDANCHIELPPPTIIKPVMLWTGKQVFSVLLRPNKASRVRINLEAKTKSYTTNKDMCIQDGYLIIRDSEIICGSLDKSNVGSGSKSTIFYVVLRDYGPQEAVTTMTRLAKLCARWLGHRGFSIGIDDVRPGAKLDAMKDQVVERGYANCDGFIHQFQEGRLQLSPGCTAEQTLEAKMTGELSKIRDDAGQICLNELDRHNSPLIMAVCGSKGSKINISQMVACVGQQVVNGTRIPDGFVHRTLPHFPVNSKTPDAKGFVRNSFYSGLTPTEFFFHTMGGREGLVDTAVKTAETGYMQRRLMKALEDLSVQYDYSVRNSSGQVVQFRYGDDGLDPAAMEAPDRPVDLGRVLAHCQWMSLPTASSKWLLPHEIRARLDKFVNDEQVIARSTQLFRDEVTKFLSQMASDLAKARDRWGLWKGEDADAVDTRSASDKENTSAAKNAVRMLQGITHEQMELFLDTLFRKYLRAVIEPGTAVGAIGAQSIGEPGTQMTLKTFHFAGVASMNVTLGVPRIKEIINASRQISTPIITAQLVNPDSIHSARIIKGRIEKTTLGDIAESIQEVYKADTCYLSIKFDLKAISALQLEVDISQIRFAILATSKLKLKPRHVIVMSDSRIRVMPVESDKMSVYFVLQNLKNALPKVIIKGIPSVNRAVLNHLSGGGYNLLVEGYGLRSVIATEGVDGRRTTSNHVMEVEKALGIEAARSTIIHEIQYTMSNHGMSIDHRHVMLLADLMTCKGEVLGITRFGIAKMKDSVLMLASFERTTDHLFDAAVFGKKDSIEGVSECIIMGMPTPIGTGLFKLVQRVDRGMPPLRRTPLFDRADLHPPLPLSPPSSS